MEALTAAQAIRLVRQRQHLSARSLSAKAGRSPSYISKVESGEIELSFAAFAAVSTALGFSASEIFLLVQEASRIQNA